jgi:hypothetical protein
MAALENRCNHLFPVDGADFTGYSLHTESAQNTNNEVTRIMGSQSCPYAHFLFKTGFE